MPVRIGFDELGVPRGRLLIVCLLLVLLIRWVYLRSRLQAIESRLDELSLQLDRQSLALSRLEAILRPTEPPAPAEPQPGEAAIGIAEVEAPPVAPAPEPPPAPLSEIPPQTPPSFAVGGPARSTEEWEAMLGGNWLNKVGVFVLVVGIALALGYSFTRIGPLGRVCTAFTVSLAMLVAGVVLESRERYLIFSRGLMGGGWASFYVTVFAMHAVEAARVIQNPAVGFVLLFAVAAGMILHSLRYHSETVTLLAYVVAFGTIALTEVTTLPLLALIPLAVTLLYLAHRFRWPRAALAGLICTYAVTALHGDTGSPLWQAQTAFSIYWLLFESFDILHPAAWLLPLNAAGFTGLAGEVAHCRAGNTFGFC